MRLTWSRDEDVERVVAGICGYDRGFGACKCLGFEQGGEIIGGLVFHNWCPETGVIEVSVGSLDPRWLNRTTLQRAAEYAYGDCGCQAIAARTTSDNPSARMWRALGAEEVTVPHMRGRGKPETVFVLTDEAWRNSRFSR